MHKGNNTHGMCIVPVMEEQGESYWYLQIFPHASPLPIYTLFHHPFTLFFNSSLQNELVVIKSG